MKQPGRISPRETEILDLLSRGYIDKEITATLGMSHGTLRTHMSRLFLKTRQSRRSGLVAAYLRLELNQRPAQESAGLLTANVRTFGPLGIGD